VDCNGLGIIEVLDVHEALDEEQLGELDIEGIMEIVPSSLAFSLGGPVCEGSRECGGI
jgi:hypothetical protein